MEYAKPQCNKRSSLSLFINIILATTLTGCSQNEDSQPVESPFEATELPSGYKNKDIATTAVKKSKKQSEGKCGEGKCGGAKSGSEGKCGEGKCGAVSAAVSNEPVHRGRVVPVYYGTSRKPSAPDSGYRYYSGKRGTGEVIYGVVDVNIPPGHTKGNLERPYSLLFFELSENPDKHVTLIDSPKELTEAEFFDKVSASVDNAEDGAAFVFIHGFNVTFEESILRTGQLAYDLSIQGPAIAFSWPSEGKTIQYLVDGENNNWTSLHLERLLTDIKEKSGVKKMHVLAHSMGNRAFTSALLNIAKNHDSPYFNQVVLAAPDIDADVFRTQIAPKIEGTAERITLYASSNDKALLVSSEIRGDYPRAGQAGDGLVVVEGVDTVDVSLINSGWLGAFTLGHSEYGDELIDDIYHMFHNGLSPDDRNLSAATKDGRTYWSWR